MMNRKKRSLALKKLNIYYKTRKILCNFKQNVQAWKENNSLEKPFRSWNGFSVCYTIVKQTLQNYGGIYAKLVSNIP